MYATATEKDKKLISSGEADEIWFSLSVSANLDLSFFGFMLIFGLQGDTLSDCRIKNRGDRDRNRGSWNPAEKTVPQFP